MRVSLFAFSLIGFTSSALAQEVPPTEDLAGRINLPGLWEVEDFRVVAQAMVGTPIEPRAQIRFEIDASPRADLYVGSGTENLGPFVTVIASVPDETTRTLYGTMDITYKAGQWTGPVNLENPVEGLGQPQDAFTLPTLALGSDKQQRIADALRSTTATEIRIALERDRQQLMEQNAGELEAMRASHLADLSALRQDHEAARVKLEKMTAGIEVQIGGLTDRFEKLFAEGEGALKERMAAAETEFQAEIDAANGAHQVRLRELKASQSTELGSVVAAHLEELQKLETDHAKAVGTTIAEQEREMAEVANKLRNV